MADPTIICPHCQRPVELTEALAAPFIKKAQDEARAEARKGREALEREREELRLAMAAVSETVRTRVESEKVALVASLREEVRSDLEIQLNDLRVGKEAAEKRVADGNDERLKLLKQVQRAQEAADRAQEEAQRILISERERIVREAKDAATIQAKLELAGRDQTIATLTKTIDELKKKADQGSQQLQGEAQEIVLEDDLKNAFPTDVIAEVPKGVNGADCLQRVAGPGGLEAGTIVWESKRTKNWSDSWIPKLKEDMQRAGAGVAVIVSSVLPKGVCRFDFVDGVWVADFLSAIPLATALRQGLIGAARERRAAEGHETKSGEVYEYVTGTAFRQRILAMLETYKEMAEDLDKERAAFARTWAKREKLLQKLWSGTTSVVGEIQGIAGRSALEIDAIELKALAAADVIDE